VEKCQFYTSKSTLNDFVLVRGRRKRDSARRAATDKSIATPIAPQLAIANSAQKAGEEEIRQKIATFKARKAITTPSQDGFHFNPDEPLRLIPREKPGSDE
jgi:hypothetical protein